MAQDRLGSRLGFILISAGCAIGVGNVWKFPWMAGQYGGGIFVIFYIIFLILLGLPVMTIEFSLGRASQKTPVQMYQELEPKGSKWHIHSYFSLAGNYILMMFYSVVTGWILRYMVLHVTGDFQGLDTDQVSAVFDQTLANPWNMIWPTLIVVIFGFTVCSMKLQNGLERVTKHMMLALLVLIVLVAVKSMTLPGAKEGLSFYLKPDFSKFSVDVLIGAMNQAFFTLSVGMGSVAIFGSYIDKDRTLLGESVNIILLDTFVAIMAGLIIFPATFTFGVSAEAGPSLIFITLPNIFNHMSGGRIWGSLFFLFMTFAAFSTILAVYENLVASSMALFGWSRKKSALINALAMLVLVLPCILGFNRWSHIQPLGPGKNIMDLEDFLVSNIILPLGSFIYVLFVTLPGGWGFTNFLDEANSGKGLRFSAKAKPYMTFVLPVIILALFVIGLKNFF